jgi:hypothetical protein
MQKLYVLIGLAIFSFSLTNCKKECEKPMDINANYEDSLKTNLWAYYNFNNSSFSDLSGNSRHMAGVNGISFSFDTWGNNNNALEFDGIDDYAVIDAGKNFPEGDFTISFLMMPRLKSGRIFQKANFNDAKGASFGFGFDQDQGTQNLHFYTANDNDVCSKFTDPSNSSIQPINKVIYPHAWYLITLQHTNGIQKVYINGNFVASKATPNKSFKNCATAPFYLGMWWLQDRRHFSGKIDELRIYTRALNEKEIKYLFDRLP